jgi:hypothetical protein
LPASPESITTIPAFERASGHKVTISYLPAPAISKQIDDGTKVDMTVAFTAAMDGFVKAGKFAGGARFEIIRSDIGGAVRAGSPKPNISSTDAFKNSLLAAKSVALDRGARRAPRRSAGGGGARLTLDLCFSRCRSISGCRRNVRSAGDAASVKLAGGRR